MSASLWFIPVMCVLAGSLLSFVTIADRPRDSEFDLIPRWLTGGPDAALGILTTVAASMVSLAALVLTITMVVVQLAMGQFSPRIVQTFLQDRPSQLAIGLFVATFAHAMLAMREVQFDGGGQVPGVAIVVAYVLVLTSIAMLVLYVAPHRPVTARVGADRARRQRHAPAARRAVPRPRRPSTRARIPAPSWRRSRGCWSSIDRERLVELAVGCGLRAARRAADRRVRARGGPALRASRASRSRLDRDAALDALRSALERTLEQDVAYGFRMLVDMAERSLSESPFLDPTTAVQAIDRLHDGLRQLAVRAFPTGASTTTEGGCGSTIPVMDWDAYVHLAFDEIRIAGVRSPQVTRRLIAVLQDLLSVAPPERHGPLEQQLALLRRALDRDIDDERQRAFASSPDVQGIGVAAGDGDASVGRRPLSIWRNGATSPCRSDDADARSARTLGVRRWSPGTSGRGEPCHERHGAPIPSPRWITAARHRGVSVSPKRGLLPSKGVTGWGEG